MRPAARVIVLAQDHVLLMHGVDPARAPPQDFWFTVGGGMNAGESAAEAASRELLEETGHCVAPEALGPIIARSTARFTFRGAAHAQDECFFLLETERFTPSCAQWRPEERAAMTEVAWLPVDALAALPAPVFPAWLAPDLHLLRRARADGGYRDYR